MEVVVAGLVLAASVAAGTVAHELSHALALRAFGVPYSIEWLPAGDGAGPFEAGISGRLATVTPRAVGGLSPWRLRVAAMMPLALAAPLVLAVAAGTDPSPAGNAYATAAAIGWLACALPSPQDFSLLWYAERAIADAPDDAAA